MQQNIPKKIAAEENRKLRPRPPIAYRLYILDEKYLENTSANLWSINEINVLVAYQEIMIFVS